MVLSDAARLSSIAARQSSIAATLSSISPKQKSISPTIKTITARRSTNNEKKKSEKGSSYQPPIISLKNENLAVRAEKVVEAPLQKFKVFEVLESLRPLQKLIRK